MKHNINISQTFIRFLTYTLAYFLFFADVMIIYEKQIISPAYLLGIPLLLATLLLFHLISKYFPIYILLHALLLTGIFFIPLPSTLYRILFVVLLSIETIRDFHLWTHGGYKPYEHIPWILLGYSLISYFGAVLAKFPTLATISYFIGLLFIVLHFIQLTLTGLEKQFSQLGDTTSIPGRKILVTNISIVGIFILTFVLISLFIHLFDLEYLLYDIGTLLKRVLQLIVEFLLYGIALLRALFARNTEAIEEKEERRIHFSNTIQATADQSLLANLIGNISKVLAFSFLIYFLYRIISKTLRLHMTKHVNDSDEVQFIEPKAEEKIKKKKKTSLLKNLRVLISNEPIAKIRRAYRIKIRHYKDLSPKESDTTTEIAKRVETLYYENITELTMVYQKARYSNESITKSDLAKASVFSFDESQSKQKGE